MRTRTLATAIAVAAACLGGLVGGPAPAAHAAPAKPGAKPTVLPSDFDGDGHRDLVLSAEGGAPGGAVVVLYGSAAGPDPSRREVLTQDSAGVPATSESYDRFGAQTATGDYDADGFTDLAVSASGEDMSFGGTYRRNAGQIMVLFGGKKGLTRHGATTVRQTVPASADVRRGASLATGDFNGDGRADLATGDYSTGRGGEVLYGPLSRKGKPVSVVSLGLTDGQTRVHTALDTGDVTGDGITDLVVQVHPTRPGVTGRIELHRGTRKGLVPAGRLTGSRGELLINRGATDVHVAVGDLDKDGHADIAVGGDWIHGDPFSAGAVTVVHGGPAGQARRPVQVITQDTPGVPGSGEEGDFFGHSVSIGDVNADGYGDLAVGTPTENLRTVADAGQVTVLPGGPRGVTGVGARVHHQDSGDIADTVSEYEYFGFAVQLTDLTGDGRADLAIGSKGQKSYQGRITLVPADRTGVLSGLGTVTYDAYDAGLPIAPWSGFGDAFGS
ncbi:FG-GAP-like repeat-containing protein [Streptomyces sp. NPDC057638]|uniref:FG-GAP-like repeat-containing protein n=1 Tax=Streptomyces sp. NPDC057638 TaxID=3346190 RepID=UPI00368A806A